jgi:hypothetical protein
MAVSRGEDMRDLPTSRMSEVDSALRTILAL